MANNIINPQQSGFVSQGGTSANIYIQAKRKDNSWFIYSFIYGFTSLVIGLIQIFNSLEQDLILTTFKYWRFTWLVSQFLLYYESLAKAVQTTKTQHFRHTFNKIKNGTALLLFLRSIEIGALLSNPYRYGWSLEKLQLY